MLIENTEFRRALIDTGANRSMISRSAFKHLVADCNEQGLAPPSEIKWRTDQEVEGLEGTMKMTAMIVSTLTIGGLRLQHPLIFVDKLPCSIIIGMDILRLLEAVSQENTRSAERSWLKSRARRRGRRGCFVPRKDLPRSTTRTRGIT